MRRFGLVGPPAAPWLLVVLKPAPQTPFSAIALAILAERAGLPLELFSIVTGPAAEIGGVLTASPDIRLLTFTGSTRTGEHLYRQCADDQEARAGVRRKRALYRI
ncbi:Glutarate-semialdehyde dehydrogenase DavD [Agrobacterium fabrum]|nr:Glutarate-semialdehyde dehydrogenase DavD [Agrobacterium fabrum]CAH0252200.1 Glutarate-semialdehyde dehydrogenase DavD [Agrobacterium fabrum]